MQKTAPLYFCAPEHLLLKIPGVMIPATEEVLMKESRMDRIERGMEEFFRGMEELRESQKKTDESLRKVHEEILELKESQKKTDEQILELREAQKKTDEHLNRTDENINKTEEQLKKTIKKLDDIGAKLGEMGIVQGKIAEDLFYRNVRHVFSQKNMPFSDVRRNLKKKGGGEYDNVAVENKTVLVVSIKNKLERYMIDSFLNEKLPKFRQIFPQYRDFRLLGGVGALVMDDGVGRYAEKKGLYVMTQNGEGGAMLVNRKNFMAKEF